MNAIYSMNFDGTDNKVFCYISSGSSIYGMATAYGRVVFHTFSRNSNLDEIFVCGGSLNSSSDCVKVFSGYQSGIRGLATDLMNNLFFGSFESSPSRYRAKAVSFLDIEDQEFNANTIFTDNDITTITMVGARDHIVYYNGRSVKQSYKGQISTIQETVNSLYTMTVDSYGDQLFWVANGIDTYLVKSCYLGAPPVVCKIIYKDSTPIYELAVYNPQS